LPPTFRSYTQGGILTTEFPAKSCTSNIYFPVNEAPKPGLRVTAVMGWLSCLIICMETHHS